MLCMYTMNTIYKTFSAAKKSIFTFTIISLIIIKYYKMSDIILSVLLMQSLNPDNNPLN